MTAGEKIRAVLRPVPGEKYPLFSRWNPDNIEPGNYRYWSHFLEDEKCWTLFLETNEPLGVGETELLKESYDCQVYFLATEAPTEVLCSGSTLVLSVGGWKKATLTIK
jgi:hypothetical protein